MPGSPYSEKRDLNTEVWQPDRRIIEGIDLHGCNRTESLKFEKRWFYGRQTWWIPPYVGRALSCRGVPNRPMVRSHWCEPPLDRSCSGCSRSPIRDSLWAESGLWARCSGIDRPRYADVPYGLSKPCSASDKSLPPLPWPRRSLFADPMCFSPPKPGRPATCATLCESERRIMIGSVKIARENRTISCSWLHSIPATLAGNRISGDFVEICEIA